MRATLTTWPRTTLATLAAVVAAPVDLSLAELPMPKPQHITRSSATAHRSPLTKLPARVHRILTWARAAQGLRADGFKPNTEAIGDRMVQLKAIDKALPGLAAQASPRPRPCPHPRPRPHPRPHPHPRLAFALALTLAPTLALTTLRGHHISSRPEPIPEPSPSLKPHDAAQANILAMCAKGTMSYDTLVEPRKSNPLPNPNPNPNSNLTLASYPSPLPSANRHPNREPYPSPDPKPLPGSSAGGAAQVQGEAPLQDDRRRSHLRGQRRLCASVTRPRPAARPRAAALGRGSHQAQGHTT